jgi:hypothetical protein
VDAQLSVPVGSDRTKAPRNSLTPVPAPPNGRGRNRSVTSTRCSKSPSTYSNAQKTPSQNRLSIRSWDE